MTAWMTMHRTQFPSQQSNKLVFQPFLPVLLGARRLSEGGTDDEISDSLPKDLVSHILGRSSISVRLEESKPFSFWPTFRKKSKPTASRVMISVWENRSRCDKHPITRGGRILHENANFINISIQAGTVPHHSLPLF